MDDLAKRGAIAFIGLSVGIVIIAFAMQANGHTSPYNPAWALISLLRGFVYWFWGIAISVSAGAFLIFWVVDRIQERNRQARELFEWVRQNEIDRAADTRHAIEEKREQEKKREGEAKQKLIKEEERQIAMLIESEKRKNRSAEDATDEALDSF